jgi:hypothetical protein
MALVSCRECGKEVSSQAPVCPYCGIKNPSKKSHQIRMGLTIAIIAVVIGLCAFTYHRLTRSFASNTDNAPPAATAPPASSARGHRHDTIAPAPKPPVVYTQADTVKMLLDSGLTPLQISKRTGIKRDEIKRIRREKKQAEKAAHQ